MAEAVGKEKAQEAKELGVTPGKLKMVEKLQSSTSSSINRDEWLNKPIKEINSAIKENRQHDKDKNNNSNSNRGKDIKDKEKVRDKDQDNSKGKEKNKSINKAKNNKPNNAQAKYG